MKKRKISPETPSIHELLQKASIEQDKEKLSDLQQKIDDACGQDDSASPAE